MHLNYQILASDGSDVPVIPNVVTRIAVRQVHPNTIFAMYSPDAPDERHYVVSDESGLISLVATAAADAKPLTIHLRPADGLDSSGMSTTVINLRSSWADCAPSDASREQLSSNSFVPLASDRVEMITNEELVRGGYPPRPYAEVTPQRYALWRRIVAGEFARGNLRSVAPDMAN